MKSNWRLNENRALLIGGFLCLNCFSLCKAQIAGAYYVVPLPYPSGNVSAPQGVAGINNAGQIAMVASLGPGEFSQAYIASPSGIVPVPASTGFYVGQVHGINNTGQIVGQFANASGPTAFIGTTAGTTAFPSSQGLTPLNAYAVNDSGVVTGYASNVSNLQQAFVGTPTGISLIPIPSGWTNLIGTGINASGQVTGFGTLTTNYTESFIYNGSVVSPLPQPPEAVTVMAYAINDSGQVAGYVQNGQAFTGTTSGLTMIPFPPGTAQYSYATVSYGSINNSGVIVGQLSNEFGTVTSGWIWDATQGTISLNNLVPSDWNILNAVSISNTGLILAWASYNNGAAEWVELTATPTTCNYSISPSSVTMSAFGGTSSFTVNTTPACNWNASTNSSPFLQITSASSGQGTGTVTFKLGPNEGLGGPLGGVITVNGLTFTVNQAAESLAPVAITNVGGSGTTQTFTFTFDDPAGWSDVEVIDVLINNYLDGQAACYVGITPPLGNGYVYLVDDAGDGGYAPGSPMLLSSGGLLGNSQCTVNGGVSFFGEGGSSTELVLTLSITFKPGFAGNKIIYTAIRGASGNSGWQAVGTWNVPGQSTTGPAVGGMSPARSNTTGQTYSFTFTDSNGYQDLYVLDVLTNSFLDGITACYFAYVPTSATDGYLYLVDDGGDGGYVAGTPMLLSSGGTLQNSQCTLNTQGSSASASGNSLTLNLPISFSSSFAGNQVFYLAARNSGAGNSGWQSAGSVTVP